LEKEKVVFKEHNVNGTRFITFIFIAFSLILSFSIVATEEIFFEHSAEQVALQNATKKTRERERVLQAFLDHSKDNLISIRNSLFFNRFIEDGSNAELLQDLFLVYAKSHTDFMQLRYIDRDGQEVVRVDRDSSGIVKAIRDRNLQDKSNRYYFKESKEKELEKVWFSAIDLNIEGGKIEEPYKPTFRSVLPIKYNGQFHGILIINYLMENFITKLTNAPLYDMILFDNRGYTVFHYDHKNERHSKCWGNSLNHKYNIKDDYPEATQDILNSNILKTDHFISRKLDVEVYGGLHLLLKLKESYLIEQRTRTHEQYTTVAIVVFILSILLTYLIVKLFSRTLLNLDRVQALNSQLKSLQLKNSLALQASHIGIWEWEYKSDTLLWDENMYQIYNIPYSNQPQSFDLWRELISEQDVQQVEKALLDAVNSRDESTISFWATTQDGEKIYIRAYGVSEFDESGEPIRMVGTNQDITDEYLAEKKFKDMLAYASDGIHILDTDGNLIYFSHSFANNLGYTLDEMKGLTLFDWDLLFSKERAVEFMQGLMSDQKVFETKHRKKDGSIIDVQINAKAITIDGQAYLYASQRDITREKELLLESQKNEKRLQMIIELNRDYGHLSKNELATRGLDIAVEITDSKIGYLHKVNDDQNHITLMSWNREALQHCTAGYDDHYPIQQAGIWADSAREKRTVIHNDYATELRKKGLPEGHFPVIRHMSSPVVDGDKVRMIVGVGNKEENYTELDEKLLRATAEDIEKFISRKEAEELVKEQRDELETIFNTALEGIALIDLDMKFIRVNQKCSEILGYSADELREMTSLQLTQERYREKFVEVLKIVEERGCYENLERECIRKDGEVRRLRSSLSLMPNRREILVTATDYTDLYNALETIKEQSYIDELTKLHNRKAYNERVIELWEQYKRYKITFSLVIFDIDHFKSINDTYGHQVGDEVLKRLGEVLLSVVRKNDYIFRVGGEEFAILLTNTGGGNDSIFADKIRNDIRTMVDLIEDREVTVSMGVTEIRPDDNIDTIYKRADDYLYSAKSGGRNRVVADGDKSLS
jgi:diguanylate cyclase (GGDEF)-like protein/PAS domain S-box-containing protein